MAEDKIPVLTEVYKPKKSGTLDVTPDVIAKVTAQVKPRLESEITEFVLDELRTELKRAHSDVITSTQDFVDKTKADLKTELPSMYQESVKLAQVDIDQLKKEAMDEASAAIRKEMLNFQEQVVAKNQQQINEAQQQVNDALESIAKRAEDSAAEQIGIMHSRVGTLQQEAFAKLRADFSTEKDTILNTATTEVQTAFTTQMTEGQTALQKNVEHMLNKAIPEAAFAQLRAEFGIEKEKMLQEATAEVKAIYTTQMVEGQSLIKQNIENLVKSAIPEVESRVRNQLTADLQQLLLKVKFVLPD